MDKYNAQATTYSKDHKRCALLTECYKKKDYYTIKCGAPAGAEEKIDCENTEDEGEKEICEKLEEKNDGGGIDIPTHVTLVSVAALGTTYAHAMVSRNRETWWEENETAMIVIFSVLGWYLLSYIFLKCPLLLRDKKAKLDLPERGEIEGSHYLLAHRGGSMEVLENSIPGFESAFASGVHIVECDVRMTRDQEIMVAHDMTFERMFKPESYSKECNKIRLVDSTNLPEFKDEIPLHFGKNTYQRQVTDPITYVRLEEVFQRLPQDLVLHIDIKDTDITTAVYKVVELVQKYNRQSTTILGSFNHTNNNLIRALDPTIPTFCDSKDVRNICIAFVFGFLPYMSIAPDSFPLPYLTKEIKQFARNRRGCLGRMIPCIGCIFMLMLGPIFDHLNKRGCVTSFWVVNDEADFEAIMKRTKAAGIMTDRPKHFREKLVENKTDKDRKAKYEQASASQNAVQPSDVSSQALDNS